MDMKINGSLVEQVTLVGGIVIPLANVNINDINELKGHLDWIELHSPTPTTATINWVWTKDELTVLIALSSPMQKKFLKAVFNGMETKTCAELVPLIGRTKPQSIAGITSGLTRRIKRDYGSKDDIFKSEWDNDINHMIYTPTPEYYELVNSVLADF